MAEFGSFYKETDRKFNTWCKYPIRLDSYGCGCQHECSYCYAKSLLNFRGNWHEPAITNIIKAKNKIKSLNGNEVIRLGGMTDCFQPIELKERITYKLILWFNKYRINYLIVTKSDLVANDEYLKIYDKNLAHFQITITCTDDKKALEYEKAPKVSKRIKAIEKLQLLEFDVSVRLSPFMFDWCDFDQLNSIKCDKILIEFLKVNHWIKKSFNIDYSPYTFKFGGYDNLELTYKIELVNKITGIKQKSVGEYVKEHHDYFSQNVNYDKFDCCNLTLKTKYMNYNQLELFE